MQRAPDGVLLWGEFFGTIDLGGGRLEHDTRLASSTPYPTDRNHDAMALFAHVGFDGTLHSSMGLGPDESEQPVLGAAMLSSRALVVLRVDETDAQPRVSAFSLP